MKIPDTRYAKTLDGGYIAFKVLGEGPKEIAIIGSIATNLELIFEFGPAARSWGRLASFSRLCLHDRRGTGLSDDMGGLPDLETRATDLLAVLDASGQERPMLLAAGDGGMVGALLAATHPERVGGLVWVGAQARSVAAPDWPHGRDPRDVDRLAREAEAGWGTEAFVGQMYPQMGMEDDVISFLARMQRHACGPATAVRFIRLLHEYDVRKILPTLRLPVLVVAPRGPPDDWIFEQATSTAALIPDAVCHPLPPTAARLWDPSVIEEALAFCGIEPPPPEVDRVLATVLFTDIIGSTERAAALNDAAWKEILASHDERAKVEIERFNGSYIHTTGDGLLATFDGPARAVRCAQAIAEAVRPLGLLVRAGCHTGEVERVAEDVQGLAVHIAARVAALAGASEVLVSSTVKDLTAGSGIVFEDHGRHELKGVPDRWHLYRVGT
jgi:class 3 adenylate cyclase